MKALLKLTLVFSVVISLFSSCSGTYYVTSRPVEPYYARPIAPYNDAYWIPGEWEWRNGSYVYINGYWTRPRAGRTYIAGHWRPVRRGYVWVHGHWR